MTSSFIGPTNWPTMKSIPTVFTIFLYSYTHTHVCIGDPPANGRCLMPKCSDWYIAESHVRTTFVIARQSPARRGLRLGAVWLLFRLLVGSLAFLLHTYTQVYVCMYAWVGAATTVHFENILSFCNEQTFQRTPKYQ